MPVFFALTAKVMEQGIETSPLAALLVLAWLVTGGLTLALWAAALLPLSLWLSLARRGLLAGIIIGSAAWGTALAARSLWLPFSQGTFWIVAQLLRLFTADVTCQPDDLIVGTSTFSVRIAPSCSGLEGIGLVLVFMAGYLWCSRATSRFPHSFWLIPIGTS